jgi:hypothetical protein
MVHNALQIQVEFYLQITTTKKIYLWFQAVLRISIQ